MQASHYSKTCLFKLGRTAQPGSTSLSKNMPAKAAASAAAAGER